MQKMLASDVLNLNMGTLEGFYRGVVEDNNSPNGNGECRIRILGVHTPLREQGDEEGIPTDQLPWAQQVTGLGGNATSSVPRIGSYVFCFFENGNPLQPRYFGLAPGTEKGIPKVVSPNVKTFTSTVTVYPTLVMWRWAYWVPTLNSLQSFITPRSASDSDPLAQRVKVWAKVAFVSKRLQEKAMVRLESWTSFA